MPKKKNQRKRPEQIIVNLPVYRAKFYVWVCPPKDAVELFVKTKYYRLFKNIPEFMDLGGKTIYSKSANLDKIIWVDNRTYLKNVIANLSHEVLHAIVIELGERGCKLDNENHEFYTYLMGYVMEQILSKLIREPDAKKNNNKKNKEKS